MEMLAEWALNVGSNASLGFLKIGYGKGVIG
jgi:hypothetical protein